MGGDIQQNTATPDRGRQAARFVPALLHWNKEENGRQMPWKGEKDPYRIWLSEVILQQTRVEQGLKYYEAFIHTYPDVHALAAAPEQEVYKLWEGLGYYSRCRNLIAAARHISHHLGGRFPTTYESILQLKGVGAYTAAAIASFAYDLPCAVLDGNVFRVLSRIYDDETPIDTTEGRKLFTELAGMTMERITDHRPPTTEGLPITDDRQPMSGHREEDRWSVVGGRSSVYNQALMDFGATICKPVPECGRCFFNRYCPAYLGGRQQLLPVKAKKTGVKERWLHYLVMRAGERYAIRQRTGKDIWQSLYEFPLLETDKPASGAQVKACLEEQHALKPSEYSVVGMGEPMSQRLSHRLVHFRFTVLQLAVEKELPGFEWVNKNRLDQYPFPRTLKQFIVNQLDEGDE
jgi:A/G-specific adenine glycosylase